MSTRKPTARSEDLVIEELEDEVLVYDGKNARAHSLGAAAARVWRACDGHTSIDGMAAALDLPRETVVKALEELDGADLLESSGLQIVNNGSGNGTGITRREMTLRSVKIGGAAAAVPLLYSVAVPSVAMAATPTNFQCELFSTDSCGNKSGQAPGAGSIMGCCCCCENSSASTPSCKVGAANTATGCPNFTCPSGTFGHCTGNPGSTPFHAGGCCGTSTTLANNCGCAWGRALAGGNTTTSTCFNAATQNICGAPDSHGNGPMCVSCCDATPVTGSHGPTSNGDGNAPTPGKFVACTSATITAQQCTACCCNGTVITATSSFNCCNDVNPFCCSDSSKCGKACGTTGSGC